ncbi:ATPase [Rhodobacteraceae bacterium WD3A24]|nr:ATPase [Rhodobacteraceae bacterium WD3A24]
MTANRARRFWETARAEEAEGGYCVALDARRLSTPAQTPLIVPSRRLAEAIAAEWDAQEGEIRPDTMPATRAANAAIDKVAHRHAEVAAHVADYGATDLLCYRAAGPDSLRARQEAAWAPLLDWAARELDAPLQVTTGVMPVAQPAASLEALHQRVSAHGPFELTALYELVTLSGSLVIGLGAAMGADQPEALWTASRIDETWQAEQWGEDDEAAAEAARKRQSFLDAVRILGLLDGQAGRRG